MRLLLRTAAALALVATAAVVLGSGPPRLLVTRGQSMEPSISAGDLAVLRPGASHDVGDVVAYRSASLGGAVVLHRVVAVAPDGSLTTRGDNNDWLDKDHPPGAETLGELVVSIPGGGAVLRRATSPVALGLVAFALVSAGGTAALTRRARKQRRSAVSAPVPSRGLRGLSPVQRTTAAGAACAGVLGAGVLAAAGSSGPAAVLAPQPSGRSMVFDYSAAVRPNDVYPGPRAEAPMPVWRSLGQWVQVAMTYEGAPGRLRVDALLSMPNGWTATVPMSPAKAVSDGQQRVVALDLPALDERMRTVSQQTGVPAATMRVEVTPSVETGEGTWSPSLAFDLTDTALTLSGGPESLTVEDAAAPASGPARGGLSGLARLVPPAVLQPLGLLLVTGALLVGLGVLARARSTTGGEAGAIRRRWADLLVAVEPVTAAPGRQVVDVPEFTTLARIASRYGLLVLHWERSGVATFVVQDESVTYRFRAGEAVEEVPAGELVLPRQR